jgi:hypothetical protein
MPENAKIKPAQSLTPDTIVGYGRRLMRAITRQYTAIGVRVIKAEISQEDGGSNDDLRRPWPR